MSDTAHGKTRSPQVLQGLGVHLLDPALNPPFLARHISTALAELQTCQWAFAFGWTMPGCPEISHPSPTH